MNIIYIYIRCLKSPFEILTKKNHSHGARARTPVNSCTFCVSVWFSLKFDWGRRFLTKSASLNRSILIGSCSSQSNDALNIIAYDTCSLNRWIVDANSKRLLVRHFFFVLQLYLSRSCSPTPFWRSLHRLLLIIFMIIEKLNQTYSFPYGWVYFFSYLVMRHLSADLVHFLEIFHMNSILNGITNRLQRFVTIDLN